MWYLFGQVWILLLIAFILGWVAHWLLCCRNKDTETKTMDTALNAAPLASATATPASAVQPKQLKIDDSWKPQGFSVRPDQVDDLKRVKGIGKVIEKTLNELGVYQFQQIAAWDQDNTNWVENFISFPGRIAREDWTSQAKTLTEGGNTEFSKRVDKGDLDY